MLSPENVSGADHVRALFNAFFEKLQDLPAEQRTQIEEELQRTRSSIFSLTPPPQQFVNSGHDHGRSSNTLQLLLDHLTDAVLIYQVVRDEAENIIDWYYREANICALNLLGFSREALVGKTAREVYRIDVIHQLLPMVQQVLQTGDPCNYEYIHDGKLYSISMFRIDDNTVADIAREITQQRQVEDNLLEVKEILAAKETSYQDLAESINDGFFELDREWRFSFINQRAASIVALMPSDLIGKNIWEKFPRLIGTLAERCYRDVMETRQPADFEMQGIYSENWFTVRVYPSTKGVAIFWIDISQQKRAEEELRNKNEALRLSEEKFSLTFKSSPVAIAISTASDARFIDVNDSYCELFGFKREELVGHTSIEVGLFPDPEARQKFARMLAAGKTFRNTEFRLQSKSGELRDVLFSTEFIKVEGQGCVLTTVVDLTLQKQADEERREAHAQAVWLARFPDENPNPVARISYNGTILYRNRAAAAPGGWSLQHGEKVTGHLAHFIKKAVEQGGQITYDITFKDRVYSVSYMPFPEDQYVNLYGMDVTERRMSEQALLLSEEKFTKAFRSNSYPLVISRLRDGRIIEANDAFQKFTGYTYAELIGRTSLELGIISPSVREEMVRALQANKSVRNFEFPFKRKTGESGYGLTSIEEIVINGEACVITTQMDITDRKRAEDQLRVQASIFEILNEPVIIGDLQNVITYWNPAAERTFGFKAEEAIGKRTKDLLRSEVSDEARAAAIRSLQEGKPAVTETILYTKDNRRLIVSGYSVPLRNTQGNLIGYAGVSQDITERKQAEQALIESERRFREFIESTHDTYISLDRQWRFTYANRKFGELMGVNPEDVIGKNLWEMFPQYLGTDAEKFYRKVMIERVPVDFMHGGIYTKTMYDMSLYPTQEGLASFGIDRTEELRHQQQVEDERARLDTILQSIPVGVWIFDAAGRMVGKNLQADRIWAGDAPMSENIDQYLDYPTWDVNTGEKLEPEDYPVAELLRTGQPVGSREFCIQRFDGSEGFVIVSAMPIKDRQGQWIGIVGINLDVTEQRRIEKERQQALVNMEVQRRLMEHREQDRNAMARDLHDGPIQTLSSTMFHLKMIKDVFPDAGLQTELDQIGMDIRNTVRELRDLMNDLRPPALLTFGFSKVIRLYIEDFRTRFPDLEIEMDIIDDDRLLSSQVHLTLFRIFQAGINNIIRHSGASKAWVVYRIEEAGFYLELRDNGRGFEHNRDFSQLTRDGHFGLVGMKERAEAISGEFSVSSEPGKGTTISVKGPLNGANMK